MLNDTHLHRWFLGEFPECWRKMHIFVLRRDILQLQHRQGLPASVSEWRLETHMSAHAVGASLSLGGAGQVRLRVHGKE